MTLSHDRTREALGTHRPARLHWADALRWSAWAALSFPAAVLSHEAAHYVSYLAFGFGSPELHYGSAGYEGSSRFWELMRAGDVSGAAAIVTPWQAGAAAAAGVIATYITVLLCVWAVRARPHPFLFGLGLVAPLRFIGSLMILVIALLGKRTGASGTDEGHIAVVFPVSELALHLSGVAALLVAWISLLRAVPVENRKARIAGLIFGIVAGGALYIRLLGPLLLP